MINRASGNGDDVSAWFLAVAGGGAQVSRIPVRRSAPSLVGEGKMASKGPY